MAEAPPIYPGYPGGSKSRVNRAGDKLRVGALEQEDLAVVEEWRAAHRAVLNTFQAILRNRTRNTDITVAQRHKRKRTISDKLQRLPGMQLSRMDDVAGCRLIFSSIRELHEFRSQFHAAHFDHVRRNDLDKYDYIKHPKVNRSQFHAAHFDHVRRNDLDKYDYIKHPKVTGYRGIHDVYEYNGRSNVGKGLAGLYVEIQYRTLVQHAWATAVELIGFVTESQPKFQQGDRRYENAMALASEILARAFEKSKGPFPDEDDRELVRRFSALDQEIGLLRTLRGLNAADKAVTENRNAILIFSAAGDLEVQTYRDATNALQALFNLEKQHPDRDVVLVRADTNDEVRLAFKNYFSDAKDFIRLVENGCAKLSATRRVSRRILKARHR